MKYILVSFDDDKWTRETLPKAVAALAKLKPTHVQTVTMDKDGIREAPAS